MLSSIDDALTEALKRRQETNSADEARALSLLITKLHEAKAWALVSEGELEL